MPGRWVVYTVARWATPTWWHRVDVCMTSGFLIAPDEAIIMVSGSACRTIEPLCARSVRSGRHAGRRGSIFLVHTYLLCIGKLGSPPGALRHPKPFRWPSPAARKA